MKIHRGKKYDILVCGCGCAGFCAAVSAAREGASVAVIEKYNAPGGILTVLGNNSIDQFNNPFINGNKMVITGIGWEYVKRLYHDGFAVIPDMDAEYQNHAQYGVKVNPVAAAKVMDDMLIEAGVDIYYGQPAVDVNICETDERNMISSIIISTKDGLAELSAKVYIDCTGDGDLAHLAGAQSWDGDEKGTFQPGTLRFYPSKSSDSKVCTFGDNMNHVKLNTTDSNNITEAEIESRKMMYSQMMKGDCIMATAPAVAPREGRRIAGISKMECEDYCSGKIFEDSVCYSYWFVDIHRDDMPAVIKYIKHDKTPTIRLSSMISADIANLMTAGRCVSSDRETNSALRVKASCMAMGQAAGTAAAICVKQGLYSKLYDFPISEIKSTLDKNGAVVPGISQIPSFSDMMR